MLPNERQFLLFWASMKPAGRPRRQWFNLGLDVYSLTFAKLRNGWWMLRNPKLVWQVHQLQREWRRTGVIQDPRATLLA